MLVVTFFMDVYYGRGMRFHKINYTYMLTPGDVRDEMRGSLFTPSKNSHLQSGKFLIEFHTQQEPF